MQGPPHFGWPALVRRLAAVGGSAVLLGCSGSHESRRVPPPEAGHVHVAPTADVPALLGLSIDGLGQRLGPSVPLPQRFLSSEASRLIYAAGGQLDSLKTFRTGGLLVLATYNAHSRQVRDLLLLGHHEDSLMGRARLRTSSPNYLVMPVFRDNHSFQLLGLRIIPTH